MLALAKHCPNVAAVDFGYNASRSLLRTTADALTDGCKRMRRIEFSNNENLSDGAAIVFAASVNAITISLDLQIVT